MKQDEEPISGILRETPAVVRSLGKMRGTIVLIWALWVARRRGRWLLTMSAVFSYVGLRWIGWT
jgi:hypothetical protein